MAVPKILEEYMEVVGSDGAHVGFIDQIVERTGEIKLTKDDSDGSGEAHYIPLAWVIHAGIKVHLNQSGDMAKARWSTHRE